MSVLSLDTTRLLRMTWTQLDTLFSNSPAGPIPNGTADGTAIVASGTPFSAGITAIIKLLVWKGKTFDAGRGTLTNRILPNGIHAVVANVYQAPSLLDQKECIVLDYAKTSFVAHFIRDEIRLIGPHFYLGRVYWGKQPLMHFCLDFADELKIPKL